MGLNFFHKYYITVTNLLLLKYLSEVLEFNRVQLKIDIANIVSQKAAKSIGYKKDCVLRSYILRANGECLDVVMFSILREEWKEAKHKLIPRITKKLKLSEKDVI